MKTSKLMTYVVIPLALVMAAATLARAYDSSWIAAGQPVSSQKLKTTLDELQSRLTALEASKSLPVGTVVAFAGTTAPNGWLLCDGQTLGRTAYAPLFAVIGTLHGGGDGTSTFNLPDYRGRFLRGADNGAGRDPDAAARTAPKPGGSAGDAVGSVQDDAFEKHTHGVTAPLVYGSLNGKLGWADATDMGPLTIQSDSTGGSETRPVNAAVNWIIKFQ